MDWKLYSGAGPKLSVLSPCRLDPSGRAREIVEAPLDQAGAVADRGARPLQRLLQVSGGPDRDGHGEKRHLGRPWYEVGVAAAPTATMAPMSEQRAAEEAFRFLRGHTTCEIRFDEQYLPLRYVIEPGGRLVAPVSVSMLEAADSVLFVPSNEDQAMEIQVTLVELDPDGPDGAYTDRWRIYHGEPQEARWAAFDYDAARVGEQTFAAA